MPLCVVEKMGINVENILYIHFRVLGLAYDEKQEQPLPLHLRVSQSLFKDEGNGAHEGVLPEDDT